MRSTPRFSRGTSVIAALILAALLGAIALGLHAMQSNSVNTAALPAQAAAPAGTATNDGTCSDGEDYTYVAAPATNFYPDEQGGQSLPAADQTPVAGKPTKVQTCPSDDQALQYQKAHPVPGQVTVNGQTQGLPKTITIPPGTAIPGAGNSATTRNDPQCENNQLKSQPVAANLCTYTLQTNNTYKLDNWMCRVSLTGPSGSGLCYVKDVSPNGNINAPSATNNNGTSGGTSTSCSNGAIDYPSCTLCSNNNYVPSGGTCVTVSSTKPLSPDLQNCTGNSLTGGYTCTGITPQQAQAALQPLGNYSCSSTDAGIAGGVYVACSLSTTSGGFTSTQNCVGSNSEGGFSCTDITPQQAQAELQKATGANYSCATNPNDSSSVLCNAPTTTTTCTNGGTNYPTCTPPGGGGGGGGSVGGNGTSGNGSGSSNGSNLLSSFLSGLAKGLLSPCTTQQQSQYVGGNGTTLVQQQVLQPNGTYALVYVQQPTTQPYGSSQPCGAAQQAPYGVGSNGVACTAPPAQPQCASNATPMPISASGNGCVTSYQCVPINGSTLTSTPTPQISCSPQVADVNQSVAISYSCQNATGSSGGGFSTNNQLSGTASTTISAPPSGTNTANFGITCTNNGQTASAQCSVQVNQPAIDLVADPQAVPSGQVSSIGWVTAGMQSCVISSPGDSTFTAANASNQSVSGVAQTDPITSPTEFDLTCQTLGGQTKKASTTVTIGSATSTSSGSENLTVNSSVDGQSTNHGSTVTVTWQSSNAPSGSALSLWLIDVQTENAVALIAGDQPTNGSYQWQLPAVGASCDPNSIAPCASELVAGDSYGIEGALYTPSNAFLGGSPAPANAVNPSYNDYGYTPTPFTIGQ